MEIDRSQILDPRFALAASNDNNLSLLKMFPNNLRNYGCVLANFYTENMDASAINEVLR